MHLMRTPPTRIIGLDPGLRRTGWGIIDVDGNRLSHVANGVVASNPDDELAARLLQLFRAVCEVIARYCPIEAAIEEPFVNVNPVSTLKLGQARAAVILAPAQEDLQVTAYLPNHVKKSLVGVGHADKKQVQRMVEVLLPGAKPRSSDAADALAVAICHAHNRGTAEAMRMLQERQS